MVGSLEKTLYCLRRNTVMLTPLEIENKKFSKQMVNGYNVEEIDDFLDELTENYTKLYKENAEMRERLEETEGSVSKYRTIENTLQSTLVMAQQTAEEIKQVAREQADQILGEAESKAKASVVDLDAEIKIKEKDLLNIKKQFDVYKAKMESLLISQLELLKDMNDE